MALDRAHVGAAPLRALLDGLVAHYGLPRHLQERYLHGLPVDRAPRPPLAEELMFGSPLRWRMLVLLAAVDEADVTQLTRLLAANPYSMHYATHAFLKTCVLRDKTCVLRFGALGTSSRCPTNTPARVTFGRFSFTCCDSRGVSPSERTVPAHHPALAVTDANLSLGNRSATIKVLTHPFASRN